MEQLRKKNIVIIGAGITGLSLLHYLSRKYVGRDDVDIRLFERNNYPGGTVATFKKEQAIVETGPNGFLSGKERTFELIRELNLKDALIIAQEDAQVRFVQYRGQLHELPMNPRSFLCCGLLPLWSKLRIFFEPFVKKGGNESESIYDLFRRRLGVAVAELLVDPLVSGVYAGDARNIVAKTAFPKIYDWEQQYGSIVKGLRQSRKVGARKPTLHSFQEGMGQIIQTMAESQKERIFLNSEVLKIFHRDDRYVISTKSENYKADELYVCTPAYVAAQLLQYLDQNISDDLRFINYAPVVVISMLLPREIFVRAPRGFGYLIPSCENKEILGVLFESNIFAGRAGDEDILIRFMIGGSHHPDIHLRPKKELIELAYEELEATFPTRGKTSLTKINARQVTKELSFKAWEKAIPQYDQINQEMNRQIDIKCRRFRDLYLLGNYRGGVSFNDCIENAFNAAQQSSI